MSVSLSSIESAFKKITKNVVSETTFDVYDTVVTLRVLTPEEENAVKDYAHHGSGVGTADEDSRNSAVADFIERIKVDTLARSIVKIGNLDLRGVDFIDTTDNDGNPIKYRKYEVLRDHLLKFDAPHRTIMFRKYHELITIVEISAERAIKWDATDIDREITRLTNRITELTDIKKSQSDRAANEFSKILETAAEVAEEEPEEPQEDTEEVETDPTPLLPVRNGERVGFDTRKPVYASQPQELPQASPHVNHPVQQPQPNGRSVQEIIEDDSSLVSPDDDMQSIIAAESIRIQQSRAGRRLAPHIDSTDFFSSTYEEEIDDVPAPSHGPRQKIELDRDPNINPRFVPPKK